MKGLRELTLLVFATCLVIYGLIQVFIFTESGVGWNSKGERVSVCFSGQVRTFRKAWPSIKAHFLDLLPYPYDIHMVFESESERSTALKIFDSLQIYKSLPSSSKLEWVTRGQLFIENSSQSEIRQFQGPESDWILLRNREVVQGDAMRYVHMLHGLDNCLQLRKSAESKLSLPRILYSHSARLRYDTIFQSDMPMENVPNLQSDEMLVPAMQAWDGINDKMALGASWALEKYFSQLQSLRTSGILFAEPYCGAPPDSFNLPHRDGRDGRSKRVIQSEACLKLFMVKHGIHVRAVDVKVVILRLDGSLSKT
jgi:hypothetical protein